MGPYARAQAELVESNSKDVTTSRQAYGLSPIKREDMVEVTYEARNASSRSFGFASPFDGDISGSRAQRTLRGNESEEELRSPVQ